MNAPLIHRTILKRHVAAVEAKHPIKLLGLLPRGSAAHVFDDDAFDFLAEKRAGLDLLGLCEATTCRRVRLLAYFGEASAPPVGLFIALRRESSGE